MFLAVHYLADNHSFEASRYRFKGRNALYFQAKIGQQFRGLFGWPIDVQKLF
jgi:hypothetical protein